MPSEVGCVELERTLHEAGASCDPSDVLALAHAADLDDIIFIDWTSGTTGRPKGVEVSHRGMAHWLFHRMWLYPAQPEGEVWAMNLFFVWYWHLPLCQGATLLVVPDAETLDVTGQARFLTQAGATRIDCTSPSLLTLWLQLASTEDLAVLAGRVTLVTTSGEALPLRTAEAFHAKMPRGTRLVNILACTETSSDMVWCELTPEVVAAARACGLQYAPIGRPTWNNRVHMEALPPPAEGEAGASADFPEGAGEIFYEGLNILPNGYYRLPEKNAVKFASVPAPAGCAAGAPYNVRFRAGDVGVWVATREQGRLLCIVGRADAVVKVRGHRVELEAVEDSLRECPCVGDVGLVVRDSVLHAFAVFRAAVPTQRHMGQGARDEDGADGLADACIAEMLAHARALLPAAHVPSRVYAVPRLPYTTNGKLKRAALAERLENPQLEADAGAEGLGSQAQREVQARAPSSPDAAKAVHVTLDAARAGVEVGSATALHGGGAVASSAPHAVGDGSGDRSRACDDVAEAWSALLGVNAPALKVGCNFFEVGGTSLLAVQLAARLRIPVPDVFEHVTLAALTRHVAELRGEAPSAAAPERILSPRIGRGDAVAVVGLAGRWPGGAHTWGVLWEEIWQGRELIERFTEGQMAAAGVPAEAYRGAGWVPRGAVLEEEVVRGFDCEFWGFSRGDAALIDPVQRVVLACGYEALEDAGVDALRAQEALGHVAVTVCGASLPTYLPDVLRSDVRAMRHTDPAGYFLAEINHDKDYVASRLAYHLNLTGPVKTVATACSSSLVAVADTAASVRAGCYGCDAGLAGGASIFNPQRTGYRHLPAMILSPDGHCRPFDAQAAGTVPCNACALVALRPLSAVTTEATGAGVYGVVRGAGVNNDGGRKAGFSAPSSAAQSSAIQAALADAELAPQSVSYVECHGTGTLVGDPIELAGLQRAFQVGTAAAAESGHCAVGSVKSNLGHANTAAGIVGLTKLLASLQGGQLAPTLHFRTPNPKFDFARSPFVVQAARAPWAPRGGAEKEALRVAGVSSFGIGGSNAHVVACAAASPHRGRAASEGALSSSQATWVLPDQPLAKARTWYLIPLSTRTEASLERACAALPATLSMSARHAAAPRESEPGASDAGPDTAERLALIERGFLVGRAALTWRSFAVVRGPFPTDQENGEMDGAGGTEQEGLAETGEPHHAAAAVRGSSSGVVFGAWAAPCAVPVGARPRRAVLMFPGQGAQYPGMGACLGVQSSAWRTAVAECGAVLGVDIDALLGGRLTGKWRLACSHGAQVAVFVTGYAMSEVLRRGCGIRPAALIGHSVGEYVAACAAGVMDLADALRVVSARGALCDQLPPGRMAAVLGCEEKALREVLAQQHPLCELACANAPACFTVTGPTAAMEALHVRLELGGGRVQVRWLHTAAAFHSAHCEAIMPALEQCLREVALRPPSIPVLSNVSGSWLTDAEATSPAYWARHLRHAVRFHDGILAAWECFPGAAMVEAGAGRSLCHFVGLAAAAQASRDGGSHTAPTPRPMDSPSAAPAPIGTMPTAVAAAAAGDQEALAERALVRAVGEMWACGVEIGGHWEFMPEAGTRRACLPPHRFESTDCWPGTAPEPSVAAEDVAAEGRVGRAGAEPDGGSVGAPRVCLLRLEWRPALRRTAGEVVAAEAAGPRWPVLMAEDTPGVDQGWLRRELLVPHALAGSMAEAVDAAWLHQRVLFFGAFGAREALPAAVEEPAAQQRVCARFLDLVQQLVHSRSGAHLWVVVTGSIRYSALRGLAKAVRLEHPELSCRCILWEPSAPINGGWEPSTPINGGEGSHVLPSASTAELPGAQQLRRDLAEELRFPADPVLEPEVDLCAPQGGRRVPRLVPWCPEPLLDGGSHPSTPHPPHPAFQADPAGTYLITGGMRGLGLALALWLVRDAGARHVALLGRSSPAPGSAGERALEAMRAAGCRVLTLEADVAEAAALKRALAETSSALPPLAGVFHAAGVVDDGALRKLTAERCEKVLAPKTAAWHLHRMTSGMASLRFMLLFSSTASLWGTSGQSTYCAANAFLDALAEARTARGDLTLALQWGGWGGVGMSADLGLVPTNGEVYLTEQQGLQALSATLAAALHKGGASGGGCTAVLQVGDWAAYRADRTLFAHPQLPLLGCLPHQGGSAMGGWAEAGAYSDARGGGGDSPQCLPGLLPLLGAPLVSGGGMCVWERRVDLMEEEGPGDNLSFLSDHAFGSEILTPATFYLNLAIAAGLAAVPGPHAPGGALATVELQDVAFLRPMRLRAEPNSGRVVRTVVDAGGAGTRGAWLVRIMSRMGARETPGPNLEAPAVAEATARDEPATWLLHATCSVTVVYEPGGSSFQSDPGTAPRGQHGHALQRRGDSTGTPSSTRAREVIAGGALYEEFGVRGGFWYGPAFRGVVHAWRGGAGGEQAIEAGALVRTPLEVEAGAGGFAFHPAVWDACTHVASLVSTAGLRGLPSRIRHVSLRRLCVAPCASEDVSGAGGAPLFRASCTGTHGAVDLSIVPVLCPVVDGASSRSDGRAEDAVRPFDKLQMTGFEMAVPDGTGAGGNPAGRYYWRQMVWERVAAVQTPGGGRDVGAEAPSAAALAAAAAGPRRHGEAGRPRWMVIAKLGAPGARHVGLALLEKLQGAGGADALLLDVDDLPQPGLSASAASPQFAELLETLPGGERNDSGVGARLDGIAVLCGLSGATEGAEEAEEAVHLARQVAALAMGTCGLVRCLRPRARVWALSLGCAAPASHSGKPSVSSSPEGYLGGSPNVGVAGKAAMGVVRTLLEGGQAMAACSAVHVCLSDGADRVFDCTGANRAVGAGTSSALRWAAAVMTDPRALQLTLVGEGGELWRPQVHSLGADVVEQSADTPPAEPGASADEPPSAGVFGGAPYSVVVRSGADVAGIERVRVEQSTRRPPAPGEVEIYTGGGYWALNFRDVLLALDVIPATVGGQELGIGGECTGRVAAVGEGVRHVAVGDEVVACPPDGFGSYVTVLGDFVLPKPATLDAEGAVGVTLVFATAWLALRRIARLAAGERILVHSGAGGVGLAAIQIAQAAGAEVYATAGTTEKRAYLLGLGVARVFDSRTLAFVDAIKEATHGYGVDVVLNSLAGEAMRRSVELLAPFGRFVEIGKRDQYEHTQLDLSPFLGGLTYSAAHLDVLMQQQPAVARGVMEEVWREIEAGRLRPLPSTVFALPRVHDALHYMAKGVHIGKVLVSMPPADATVAVYKEVAPAGASHLPVDVWTSLTCERCHVVCAEGTGGCSTAAMRYAQALATPGEAATDVLVLTLRASASEGLWAERTNAEPPAPSVTVVEFDDRGALAAYVHELRHSARNRRPIGSIVHICGGGAGEGSGGGGLEEPGGVAAQAAKSPACHIQVATALHALALEAAPVFVGVITRTIQAGTPMAVHYQEAAVAGALEGLSALRRRCGVPSVALGVHLCPLQPDSREPSSSRIPPWRWQTLAPQPAEAAPAMLCEAMAARAEAGMHAPGGTVTPRDLAEMLLGMVAGLAMAPSVTLPDLRSSRAGDADGAASTLQVARQIEATNACAEVTVLTSARDVELQEAQAASWSGARQALQGERGQQHRGRGPREGARRARPAVKVVQAWLKDLVVAQHGLKPQEVDLDRSLEEYGMDSLALIGLAHKLTRFVGTEVSAADIYDFPTTRLLAAHLGRPETTAPAQSRDPAVGTAAENAEARAAPHSHGAVAHSNGVGAGVELPRVLFMHGFRTNAQVMRLQAHGLASHLAGRFHVEFLNAPHAATGGGDPSLEGIGWEAGELHEWWGRWGMGKKLNSYTDGWRGPELDGLEMSVRHVTEHIERHGPYAGIAGFSQGACVAALVLQALQQARTPAASVAPPRFALLFSAVTCPALGGPLSGSTNIPITCPSLHIFDPCDEVNEMCQNLVKEFDQATAQEVLHDAGHALMEAKSWLDDATAYEDPSDSIADFDAVLKSARRKNTLDDDEVNEQFSTALDPAFYAPVVSRLFTHQQRATVDLLTMQQWLAGLTVTILDVKKQLQTLTDMVNGKGYFTPRADKKNLIDHGGGGSGVRFSLGEIENDLLAEQFQVVAMKENNDERFETLCMLAGGKPAMFDDVSAFSFGVAPGGAPGFVQERYVPYCQPVAHLGGFSVGGRSSAIALLVRLCIFGCLLPAAPLPAATVGGDCGGSLTALGSRLTPTTTSIDAFNNTPTTEDGVDARKAAIPPRRARRNRVRQGFMRLQVVPVPVPPEDEDPDYVPSSPPYSPGSSGDEAATDDLDAWRFLKLPHE
ncbi:hypothetical protein CYMTET_11903 [Cymbomonas tetramitiformis]|uniref:Uncharacterized protein n=1 Tax=Cymbomonas tetramitiformis TaxID=36881 RepID=A0AAE0LCP8_9CHLO|nr:hypothetical protein CYMTET_11903 [Cymbomonas tetramitiformis]